MDAENPIYLTNVNAGGDQQQAESWLTVRTSISQASTGPDRRRRSLIRSLTGRALLTVVLLFTVVILLIPGNGTVSAAVGMAGLPAGASGSVLSPVADSLDDLIEILKKIEKELRDADEEVGSSGSRPHEPSTSVLALCLDNAEAFIDQVLNPLEDPSLEPFDAGSVDPGVEPVLLEEFADECLLMAEQAADEAEFGCPADHEVVGTKLQTIKSCLPGYRAAAGLS
jgi:hypothetical protein